MNYFAQKDWDEEVHNAAELSVILSEMPNIFSQALVFLMEHYHISINDLAENSGVSVPSIKRIRTRNWEEGNINTIVRLCVGMKLHPVVSFAFIECSPCRLTSSVKHTLYKNLILKCKDMTYEDIQKYLQFIEQYN